MSIQVTMSGQAWSWEPSKGLEAPVSQSVTVHWAQVFTIQALSGVGHSSWSVKCLSGHLTPPLYSSTTNDHVLTTTNNTGAILAPLLASLANFLADCLHTIYTTSKPFLDLWGCVTSCDISPDMFLWCHLVKSFKVSVFWHYSLAIEQLIRDTSFAGFINISFWPENVY